MKVRESNVSGYKDVTCQHFSLFWKILRKDFDLHMVQPKASALVDIYYALKPSVKKMSEGKHKRDYFSKEEVVEELNKPHRKKQFAKSFKEYTEQVVQKEEAERKKQENAKERRKRNPDAYADFTTTFRASEGKEKPSVHVLNVNKNNFSCFWKHVEKTHGYVKIEGNGTSKWLYRLRKDWADKSIAISRNKAIMYFNENKVKYNDVFTAFTADWKHKGRREEEAEVEDENKEEDTDSAPEEDESETEVEDESQSQPEVEQAVPWRAEKRFRGSDDDDDDDDVTVNLAKEFERIQNRVIKDNKKLSAKIEVKIKKQKKTLALIQANVRCLEKEQERLSRKNEEITLLKITKITPGH